MKKAIAVVTYARSHYLSLVLPSILTQRMDGKAVTELYELYVFQDGLWEGEPEGNRIGHARISALLDRLPKHIKVIKQAANLGVALHFDFVEKLLFAERGYDFVAFCEDDLIFAPGYMSALDRMAEKFAGDPRVGMMAAHPGNCTVDIETQRANQHRYAPMGHNWGFGLTRSFWTKRQPFVECYLDLIRSRPYRDRPHELIHRWLEHTGFRRAASSQDYVKQCATLALGACRLSTFANFGLPIGRSGLHFRPEIFKKIGFDRTVVFDGELDRAADLDEEQFQLIYSNGGSQVGVSNIRPIEGSASFNRTEWLERLRSGRLHPRYLQLEAAETPAVRPQPRVWKASDLGPPSMEPEGREHFERRVRDVNVFLEYGAGGSTLLAAKLGAKEIHSVESDKGFLAAVRDRIGQDSPATRIRAHYVDIGPTKEWGVPRDASSAVKWPMYCLAPWPTMVSENTLPDLILIDGRFRVASFLASLMFAKPGTPILFDDYFDRPHYHHVEKHLAPTARAGRMAEFIVPADMDSRGTVLSLLPFVTNPA